MIRSSRAFVRRIGEGEGLLAEASHKARLRLALRRRRPVLVYSPGQTASMTVTRAIQRVAPERLMLHMHWVSARGIETFTEERAEVGAPIRPVLGWRAEVVRHLIAGAESRLEVVTLVRDPVSRAVSSYFADRWAGGSLDPDAPRDESTLSALQSGIVSAVGYTDGGTWLEQEFLPVTGVDLLSSSFDPAQGWARVDSDRFRCLVLRLESLDESAEGALEQLLEVSSIDLRPVNTTTSRPYGDLYDWFRKNVRLPEEWTADQYDSAMVRHFYTDQEIETMRLRWAR